MRERQGGRLLRWIAGMLMVVCCAIGVGAEVPKGQIIEREIQSKSFAENKIGTNPVRKVVVYLPPAYNESARRFPVIYFLASPFDRSFRAIFDDNRAEAVFDRAIGDGAIGKFIVVCPDMTTPLGSSWYVNSPVTGNWEDFLVKELVPYIDANFRTMASRDSRGITGIFMGGHGAIRFAMKYPEVFGSVYGLHPVGTGSGLKIMLSLPNWTILENAKTLSDVRADGYSTIFTGIFQAFLPNVNKPPLYVDLAVHKNGDDLAIDSKLAGRVRDNFFLESLIPQYAENMKSLRGFRFDWARSDPNQDHVYSNQAFTHKLNEFGIVHEAEEYNGTWGEQYWGEEGRISTEVLPFFQRHLVFERNDNGRR